MAASTSYSTATGDSNINHCSDVFINHRGPDVKKTFASHLYRRLISHRLRVFLDYQVMQEGEYLTPQIKDAIRTASVHIAIFSPTYAESKWCLDELVLMLESGVPIIPVFHNVKPAELRSTHGEGVYARSLQNLQNKRTHDSQPRHDSITIEKWRSALSRVADISGLDLEAFKGDEVELLDKLVEVVLKKVKKPQLNVAKYPTGLDGKVEDFETTVSLHQHSGRVQVVGITGLGGVGKTTLAKELFNKKSSNYSKSCFLFDVRENAKTSLLSLQKKLLKCLTESDLKIDHIDEGKEMLKNHFSELNPNLHSQTVLLVLDDVDDVNQVHTLLPVTFKDILLPNSLILITSRDKRVLTRSGVQESSIYKLIGLNTQCSRELFCSHAFCQPHPLPGFERLVDKFLRACDGLPLSLKVIGALLCGNTNTSEWDDELQCLEKILPGDIQKSLQISYNALQREEQDIFLDIACFFIGEDRDTAIRIWDASGWKGRRGFQSLLDKCLVELVEVDENKRRMHKLPLFYRRVRPGAEVDLKYTIAMHDHLRDLGRDLAKDSKLPRRIWRGTGNIDDFLQQSSDVRGIRMLCNENGDDDEEHPMAFSSYEMTKLQLLHIEGVASDLRVFHSPNLIWLRWDNCPCPFLSGIWLKKLKVLHVRGWGLETLWQDGLQAPSQLRELHIDAPLSNIPESIGQLQHLEKVVVIGGNFENLPEEICHLPSLKHLEFRDTPRLRSLPDPFGDLTNLEHIQLSDCSDLERLPISFGNLIKLKYLDLSYCSNLSLLSGSFGNISTLEYIDLTRCENIEVLPSQIAHQRPLKILHLNLPNLREWPSVIGEPSGLEEVVLKAPLLETLPSSLGRDLRNLKYLELRGTGLRSLPDSFGDLTNLEHIQLFHCIHLERLPISFGNLIKLKYLDLSYCSSLSLWSGSFGNLSKLEYIDLTGCEKIEVLPFEIAHQRSLKRFYLSLPNLREWPSAIGEPSCLGRLTQLRELVVSRCPEVEELQGFEHWRSLEVLKASQCVKLKSFCGLSQLTQLRILDVHKCPELEELEGFIHLRSLEVLNASQCVKLKSLWGLSQLTQLRELYVSECPELEELQGFEHLRSLEVLNASQCVKLKSLWGLPRLTKLKKREDMGIPLAVLFPLRRNS